MSPGFVVALHFRSVARWVRRPKIAAFIKDGYGERMVETIGLNGVKRVYVVSTTLVGMGLCCVVDRSEPSARRRRIQGRTPECAPVACSIFIDLVRGMSFQLLASSPHANPQNLQRISQEGNL